MAGFERGSRYENNANYNIDYDSVSHEVDTDHNGATNDWARWSMMRRCVSPMHWATVAVRMLELLMN